MKYLKYIMLLALYYILFAYAVQYQLILSKIELQNLLPYMIIFVFLIVFNHIYLNKLIKFWQVFAHEISHLIFALVFFRKITNFVVTENSGVVTYLGRRNWLITLAPYTAPLITLLLLAFALVGNYNSFYFKALITVSYSFYFSRLIQDFSWKQADIENVGNFFSTLWIIGINLLILLFIILYFQNQTDFMFNPNNVVDLLNSTIFIC